MKGLAIGIPANEVPSKFRAEPGPVLPTGNGSSDALLLLSEALREAAHEGDNLPIGQRDRFAFTGRDTIQGLRRLADTVSGLAPTRAGVAA